MDFVEGHLLHVSNQLSKKKTIPSPAHQMNVSSPRALVHRREVGREAVWSLSTAKPGNGVDQLRDGKFRQRFVRLIVIE